MGLAKLVDVIVDGIQAMTMLRTRLTFLDGCDKSSVTVFCSREGVQVVVRRSSRKEGCESQFLWAQRKSMNWLPSLARACSSVG